nr:BCCT family transporter [Siphonobacter sp. BAB-5385]
MSRLSSFLAQTTFHKGIILPSLLFILFVTFVSSFFPDSTASILGQIQDWIFINLNWVYVWSVTLFVFFLLALVVSKYGSITLGDDDVVPEYSFFPGYPCFSPLAWALV